MNKDYYKILGLNKDATDDDIKMAYKRLAMKYHPDRNPNDSYSEEKFKEIKNAYEVLTNRDKNLNDISDDLNVNFDNSRSFNFSDFIKSESVLDDVFKVIFQKDFDEDKSEDFDVISILEIDLEQAVYGSIVPINIYYQIICNNCSGKGYKLGSEIRICSKCSGSGLYTIVQGLFTFRQKCFKCNGKGVSCLDLCGFCDGSGKIEENLVCDAYIFPGSDNDFLASLYVEENDLILNDSYLLIKIKPHPIFIRKDIKKNDLFCKFIIDFCKAILGGYIKVYTLYGYINYKIKNSVQCNDIYKIKQKGLNFSDSDDEIGDLYIEILIELPFKLNFYQIFLLKKLKLALLNNFINYPLINNWNKLIYSFYRNILR